MSDAARRALWRAIEDSGLWEVVWDLNGARADVPANANRATALEAVRWLLERDWIERYRIREPDGEPADVPTEEARRLLDSPDAWEPAAAGEISVRIRATEEGEKAYQ
jgi:hypothetical protein